MRNYVQFMGEGMVPTITTSCMHPLPKATLLRLVEYVVCTWKSLPVPLICLTPVNSSYPNSYISHTKWTYRQARWSGVLPLLSVHPAEHFCTSMRYFTTSRWPNLTMSLWWEKREQMYSLSLHEDIVLNPITILIGILMSILILTSVFHYQGYNICLSIRGISRKLTIWHSHRGCISGHYYDGTRTSEAVSVSNSHGTSYRQTT